MATRCREFPGSPPPFPSPEDHSGSHPYATRKVPPFSPCKCLPHKALGKVHAKREQPLEEANDETRLGELHTIREIDCEAATQELVKASVCGLEEKGDSLLERRSLSPGSHPLSLEALKALKTAS